MDREAAISELLILRNGEMEETGGRETPLVQAIDLALADLRAAVAAARKPMDSIIRAFVEERCEVTPGVQVECAALYAAWVSWCADQGREHPGTVQVFGRNLSSAIPAVTMARPRVEGAQVRVYQGIRPRHAAHEMETAP
jgi:hypothetical protein